MTWKPGDECVCIKRGPWFNELIDGPALGPKFGEECTVFEVVKYPDCIALALVEHRHQNAVGSILTYDALQFRKKTIHKAQRVNVEIKKDVETTPKRETVEQ